jgi:hypothetical protein
MRKMLGLAAATFLVASAAHAQPAPPGSYRAQCTNIRMDGIFLSATCRGPQGGGQSQINVQSCAGDIGVDVTGALSCRGPGAGQAYNPGPLPPGAGDPRPRSRDRDPRPPDGRYDRGYDRGYDRDVITVYARRNWQGRSQRLDGVTPNLAPLGLNDHIRSIRIDRRSGPWLVCEDANFRGHCVRLDRDVADTRAIGMNRAISSLRPAR